MFDICSIQAAQVRMRYLYATSANAKKRSDAEASWPIEAKYWSVSSKTVKAKSHANTCRPYHHCMPYMLGDKPHVAEIEQDATSLVDGTPTHQQSFPSIHTN